ncbi:tetratricopeptide repeat protein [Psychrobacillus sp. FJAT-51614]|uniref:Tetratricopeptide repeat protein n=1 Tax=Psychrobacillus mangrovi TaxID=3117745 RepID=A0ABU8FA43_9BACI
MRIVDFKKSLSSVNEFIYFDSNDFLREKTSNPLRLKQVISDAEYLLKINIEESDKYFLYGTVGNLYRVCGEPQKALNYLNICLCHALKEGNITRETVTLIRIGEALKYYEKHDEALEHFEKAFKKCKDNKLETYLDFALQHKGKCLMEMGRLDEAVECFIEALKLREFKGDTTLIGSTKEALKLVKRLKIQ